MIPISKNTCSCGHQLLMFGCDNSGCDNSNSTNMLKFEQNAQRGRLQDLKNNISKRIKVLQATATQKLP